MEQGKIVLQQTARWLPADMDTPISLFKNLGAEGLLLESAEVDGRWGRYSVLVSKMAMSLECREGKLWLETNDPKLRPLVALNGQDFVQGLRTLMQQLEINPPEAMPDLPAITRALYGYFGFGVASLFSQRLARVMPPAKAESCLVLPATILLFDHLYNRLCEITLDEVTPLSCSKPQELKGETPPFSSEELIKTSKPSEAGYKAWVEEIKALLRAGEAIQVVPSVRFSCPYLDDPFELYRRLRRLNASPYMFYMQLPRITLLGSSPEVMVRCTNGRLTLSPIAGTRPRGKDERADEFLASELLNDPKERAEHVMLVDLGRNDLGRIARPGSVSVDRYMQVERFSHVMHLTSSVTAQLRGDCDALDVLAATFPAGTVSGAPKIRAMEIIASLEQESRGPYAGCIGWLGLDRGKINLDFGITIRSLWKKEDTLYWQAGGGIVHDSNPELEWQEVVNKSAIMRLVLATTGDGSHVFAHR